jgi:protein involved in sex pheromone biosynthesis
MKTKVVVAGMMIMIILASCQAIKDRQDTKVIDPATGKKTRNAF